jgi:crotonobetainyl-CoA:carnitine CoA-transferase CaiB-like acyl-CoA transferase
MEFDKTQDLDIPLPAEGRSAQQSTIKQARNVPGNLSPAASAAGRWRMPANRARAQEELVPMTATDEAAGALAGITILDFSRILAGPFATQILGDLGATVIKVEPPGGDEARSYGSADVAGRVAVTPGQMGPVFASFNRNKKSIALDLKSPAGLEVARRLITRADALVHNFRTDVMESLGIGYESARQLNPDLVYCAISGFGAVGPDRRKSGNDLISQAHSGLLSFTGEPGRDPVRCPVSIGDLTAGLYAVIGVLSGLLSRERGGTGQKVETSLYEGLLSLINFHLTQFLMTGFLPQPMGTQNKMGQPNQVFQVADGWLAVSAVNDKMWQAFCRGIGTPWLSADPRFARLADRYAHREELMHEVSEIVRDMSLADSIARLEEQGVVCAAVRNLAEVATDPQLAELGAIVDVRHGDQQIPVVASALHFSATPPQIRSGPPGLGQDYPEILGWLGYDQQQIGGLAASGALGPAAAASPAKTASEAAR